MVHIRWQNVVKKLAHDCHLDRSSVKYVLKRLNYEGLSFLTKTLPLLAKAVLKGIETGRFLCPEQFRSSKARRLSRYFRVWLEQIFDFDGYLLVDVNPQAVYHCRQFCEYLYKLQIAFSDTEKAKAFVKARKIEHENKNAQVSPAWVGKLKSTFSKLFPSILDKTVVDVLKHTRPRYTSGAFFGSEDLDIPYYIYKQLPDNQVGTCRADMGGISGYFKPYPSSPSLVTLKAEGNVSKTLLVPKDSRGPRLISKEPMHLLRTQMAFFGFMSSYLEKATDRRINFRDQEINRELARKGSITREFATLDLKDASDRVLYRVVRSAFGHVPAIYWFLTKCRSVATEIDGIYTPLHKVAGMGSGLTFPLLALVTYVSIVARVSQRTNLPPQEVGRSVYVYGDDVIIPREWYHLAIEGLVASGMAVNDDKSYRYSHFRESCGGDYYNGVAVSPARLTLKGSDLPPTVIRQRSIKLKRDIELLQLDRHCRELVRKGLTSLASYYYDCFDKVIPDYGWTSGDSASLGRYSVEPVYINDNYCHYRLFPKAVSRKVKDGLIDDRLPKTDRNVRCPYKYLGSFLSSYEPGESSMEAYERLVISRSVKLEKRLVSTILLR